MSALLSPDKLKEFMDQIGPSVEHNDVTRGLYEFHEVVAGLAIASVDNIFESGLLGDATVAEEAYAEAVESNITAYSFYQKWVDSMRLGDDDTDSMSQVEAEEAAMAMLADLDLTLDPTLPKTRKEWEEDEKRRIREMNEIARTGYQPLTC